MDDYGAEVYADLLFYFQFDLLGWLRRGGGHPGPVLALITTLPEGSRFVAARRGGDKAHEWLGVTAEYRLLAHIVDAININTRATGNYRTPPKFEPWPLPERRQEKKRRVSDLLGGGVEGVRIRSMDEGVMTDA